MKFARDSCGSVARDDDADVAEERIADRALHADVRRDAADDQRVDVKLAKLLFEVGVVEGAVAGLVDHAFVGLR